MRIRNITCEDYDQVIPLVNDWWGGRKMADMLPKLFFVHFTNTSFIMEDESDKIVAFLIGFLSQSYPNEAYIHFVGVHPENRKHQLGKKLYDLFFEKVKQEGRHLVRCVTSPVNKGSIAFHTKMGFEIEEGDLKLDGILVSTNYDGADQSRVLFCKKLK